MSILTKIFRWNLCQNSDDATITLVRLETVHNASPLCLSYYYICFQKYQQHLLSSSTIKLVSSFCSRVPAHTLLLDRIRHNYSDNSILAWSMFLKERSFSFFRVIFSVLGKLWCSHSSVARKCGDRASSFNVRGDYILTFSYLQIQSFSPSAVEKSHQQVFVAQSNLSL